MKGGIGTASITLPGGLTVAALVAVNAAGDIVDPATGRIVAGRAARMGRVFSTRERCCDRGRRLRSVPVKTRHWG
jgi:L-aminopeptidase/D-esterase-like protein